MSAISGDSGNISSTPPPVAVSQNSAVTTATLKNKDGTSAIKQLQMTGPQHEEIEEPWVLKILNFPMRLVECLLTKCLSCVTSREAAKAFAAKATDPRNATVPPFK